MSNKIVEESKEFDHLLTKYARENQLLGRQHILYENSINLKQEIFEMMQIMEADLLALYNEIVDYVSQLTSENTCNE